MDNSEVEGLPSRQETDQNVDEGDGVDRRADAIALAEAAVGAGAAVEAGGAGGAQRLSNLSRTPTSLR